MHVAREFQMTSVLVLVVFVYASCWSHYSPINTLLYARGLYAVLALKKDKSDLTIEKVFELHREQQKYLKMLFDDPLTIKDLVIAGKYHLGFYAVVVFWIASKILLVKSVFKILCYACCTFLTQHLVPESL